MEVRLKYPPAPETKIACIRSVRGTAVLTTLPLPEAGTSSQLRDRLSGTRELGVTSSYFPGIVGSLYRSPYCGFNPLVSLGTQ